MAKGGRGEGMRVVKSLSSHLMTFHSSEWKNSWGLHTPTLNRVPWAWILHTETQAGNCGEPADALWTHKPHWLYSCLHFTHTHTPVIKQKEWNDNDLLSLTLTSIIKWYIMWWISEVPALYRPPLPPPNSAGWLHFQWTAWINWLNINNSWYFCDATFRWIAAKTVNQDLGMAKCLSIVG